MSITLVWDVLHTKTTWNQTFFFLACSRPWLISKNQDICVFLLFIKTSSLTQQKHSEFWTHHARVTNQYLKIITKMILVRLHNFIIQWNRRINLQPWGFMSQPKYCLSGEQCNFGSKVLLVFRATVKHQLPSEVECMRGVIWADGHTVSNFQHLIFHTHLHIVVTLSFSLGVGGIITWITQQEHNSRLQEWFIISQPRHINIWGSVFEW